MATVILLNGVGSVGKSSIAKALQNITKQPFLHIEMDAFLAMLPDRLAGDPDGLSFEKRVVDGNAVTFARVGPAASRALSGMRRSVAAMASAGNNLIVDEVLFGNTEAGSANAVAEYQSLLEPYNFYMVGVFASLGVLEERERKRGDRTLGLSRWQYERVHDGMTYDLSVNTEDASPLACAELIKANLKL
ncbi:chloramphenicol phosphotransferase CPT family protein [Ruegeria atlantica]|uniref:chloramphenicol phosphotransferase CPT family protein n=1 Tax=Ruegeria atlantica TaxID=81569 RepID=UPI00147D9A39|nr:chloramphenicol phosphotransferase [Ruegeria atlantica]